MSQTITKCRNFIMGIAIIWIALYHIPVHTTIPVLQFLQDIGYGGVDIFVFVSGFGVYHSLKKDADASRFLGRRLRRLLPAYIPFIIIWMIVRLVTYQLFFTEICGNLTMTGWWNGDANQFNWYVDGILLFYILAPYIYGYLVDGVGDNNEKNKNTLFSGSMIRACIVLVLAVVISLAFLHGQLLMAMSRLPLFILGMIVARSNDDERLTGIFSGAPAAFIWNAIMIFGFIAMYYCLYIQDRLDRWHYGLWWYPFILIVPGLVLDLGGIGILISDAFALRYVHRFVEMVGRASFELFLWHLFIFETAQAKNVEGTLVWCGLFVGAFVIGIMYHIVIERVMRPRENR